MSILDYIEKIKRENESPRITAQEPRSMYQDGQLVRNTVDGSRPGYGGKPLKTEHIGNGVYEITYKGGSKSYYGKVIRRGKTFKKAFGPDKEAAENFVTKIKKKPVAMSVIEKQVEGGKLLEKPKYKNALNDAMKEVISLQEKGYGNVDEIVKKYQDKFTQKIGTKTRQGKIIKKGTASIEYNAITFAINEQANKLNIQNIKNNNIIKALDDYVALDKVERGNITKILKKHGVSEGSFNRYLQDDKLKLRRKIPIKWTSEAQKKRFFAKQRYDALTEFSSHKFEKFLSAPETSLVQKSHMGDLYNQYVRTGNLGYAPKFINAETLKDVDATLKSINEKVKHLFETKPKGYLKEIDRLNLKGNNLAAATQGYKKYTGIDPYSGKEFTINFSKPGQELDPTDLLENKKLSELTKADKSTLETLKKQSMESAKLSKKKTNLFFF